MTHGRNSKRTNKILAHNGGTHADRRRAAAEAKRKGTLVPWEPVPVVDDPVQASEYQSEQDFIEAVEASGSGGDMVVVDWEAADMDRARNLIDLS